MTLFSRVPTVEASAITKRRYGNAIVISVTREITVSIQPRKKPAIEPRSRPRNIAIIVAPTPTSSETWAP